MIRYPLHFVATASSISSKSEAGVRSWSSTAQGRNPLPVDVPPEFGGQGQGFSPEDFFALAATNCFAATFQVIAEKSKLSFDKIEIETQLTVDRGPDGAPWMSHLFFKVALSGVADIERATRILEKTSKSCLVLNSLKTPHQFEFQVTA